MIKETQSIFNRFDKQRIFSVNIKHQEYLVTIGQPMSTAVRMIADIPEEHLEIAFRQLAIDDVQLAREVINAIALPEFSESYKSFIAERLSAQAKEAERNRFNPSFTKTVKYGKCEEISEDLMEGLRRCVGL